jgi:hypothetical protein
MDMSWFTTATSVNWLTFFLVGLTMFMVGAGAQALLEVDKKDTQVLEFFLTVAKRLGIVLTFVGACLWLWNWMR